MVSLNNLRKITWQPFINGEKVPITFEEDLRAQLVTISVNNKFVKRFYSVKERGQFERPFFLNEGYNKMEFDWDVTNDNPTL